jgi:peptide/nickel transport system substrate-binding protein
MVASPARQTRKKRREEEPMIGNLRALALVSGLLALCSAGGAFAQKAGGVLKIGQYDSPASMSIHEESSNTAEGPMMGVFNNLVLYDQHEPQNTLQSIRPDLATDWSWDEDRTRLTFHLRQSVNWHDGKPFTANDVKCTWDLLLGSSGEKLRLNPRKAWYRNLQEVTTNGDWEVTFNLKRPQPAFLALLASGWAPIYPCHVSPRDMRSHPIGTGPFKFVEFKPNEVIRVARNPRYWRAGRPYLDGIEYPIIKNPSTRILAFVSGQIDMIQPYTVTAPLLKDVKAQAPQAICEMVPQNISRDLLISRNMPPFDGRDLRRAMALSLDRKGFIDILEEGQGDIGAAMMPPPEGRWGMPPEITVTLPGYGPDVQKNRAEARQIMLQLGYGSARRLALKVSARNITPTMNAAVVLIDQLKEIYIDGEVEPIDNALWFSKIMRHDYTVALGATFKSVDDPDQTFYETYACGAENNPDGFCNPEIDKLIDRQSSEFDQEKRKQIVWEIEKQFAESGARPIIHHTRTATCRQPYVKGFESMVNSVYNGWRFEDLWLDN